jgi:hypothetical protein
MQNLAELPGNGEMVESMEELVQEWLRRTGDPVDSGDRFTDTRMLDVGQAFITDEWLDRAPPEYARAMRRNGHNFRTGEQPADPVRGGGVGW